MANGDNLNLSAIARSSTVTRNGAGDIIDIQNNNFGESTYYDRNQFNVDGLMYPNDLMAETNNQYGGNYVIFYVNVHEDSMLVKSGKNAFVDGANIPPSQRGDFAAQNLSEGTITLAATTAGVIAANTIDVAGKTGKFLDVPLTKTAGTVVNTTIGGAAGYAVKEIAGANKEYKRMQKAIALHTPNELSIKYGVTWEEKDMAMAAAMGAVAEGLGEAMKSAASLEGGQAMKSGSLATGAAGSFLASKALQTPIFGDMLSKSGGVATNPKKEQLFKNVNYRTFSFNYQFWPRSAEEAKNVREIINTFKLHMHPEYKDASHFLWIYPSEFDIYYYQNGKENMNLHRHTSCVLTDMSVLYSPQGVFTTFDDGMPTQINIMLTFTELALLSKETVQDGF